MITFPQTDPTGAHVPEPTVARRMRLNPGDFKQHGYTKECPVCVSIQDGSMVYARRKHSEPCRIRMEELIGGDRARRADARREREFDERLQQEDIRISAEGAFALAPAPGTPGLMRRQTWLRMARPTSRKPEVLMSDTAQPPDILLIL